MTIVEVYKACIEDNNLIAVFDGKEYKFKTLENGRLYLMDLYGTDIFDLNHSSKILGDWEVKEEINFEIIESTFACNYCHNPLNNKGIWFNNNYMVTHALCKNCLRKLKEVLDKEVL